MGSDLVWLNEFYKQAFPHLENIKINEDVNTQFEGVDKWFYCKNLRPLRIEEKFRNEDYGDLLLEDYSNWTTKRLGWARDSCKTTDYLAYIILPRKTLWMLNYLALRQYFLLNYDNLFARYVIGSKTGDYVWGKTFDQNGTLLFRTANIPVPLNEFPSGWLAKNLWEYHLTKSIAPSNM